MVPPCLHVETMVHRLNQTIDDTAISTFIFFSPDTDTITKIERRKLVNELGNPDPHDVSPCKKVTFEFILDKVFDLMIPPTHDPEESTS
ncbi:hypothetical protein OSB04_012643, partial [Centaurea solstitialis]